MIDLRNWIRQPSICQFMTNPEGFDYAGIVQVLETPFLKLSSDAKQGEVVSLSMARISENLHRWRYFALLDCAVGRQSRANQILAVDCEGRPLTATQSPRSRL
jgi:hypothetical protein